MHWAHVVVTSAMAACAAAALLAIYGPVPQLLGISFYLGLCALIVAMLIALALALMLIVRAVRREAVPFLKLTWLGLANGALALLFLAWFAAYAS